MKILNEYQNHHYWEEYDLCELFCPNCGKQEVYAEQSDGDYYCGPDYMCVGCGHDFSIQGPRKITWDNKEKMLAQLRTGVTHTPTTPEGH